jgi:deoxyhypusine synthase
VIFLEEIKDIKLNDKTTASELINAFANTGFQATNIAQAVTVIEKMKKEKCTVFFAFTANLAASGLRGIIKELCEKKFVDAIITTAGSIDHDIIKNFDPYYQGSFFEDDIGLHKKGINRLGNIQVPTKRYVLLEKKLRPWLEELYKKQKCVSPSEFNEFVGSKLDENSFLHWCTKNKIPVYCPGITDGAIGLQFYFFKQNKKDFCIDVTADMQRAASLVLNAEKTGAIVLGGGISKHHTIGVNILRDGLDFAVYVSTAAEFDGSLSGAQTHEAKSWGKTSEQGKTANVNCDATIAFPIIIAALKEKKIF